LAIAVKFMDWLGLTPFRWLASKIRSNEAAVPQPLAEAPLYFSTDDQASAWSPAKKDESSGTQVVGHWHVTNVSNRDLVLRKVRLEGYEATHSHVLTKGPEEAGTATYANRNPCAARYMSRVMANFWFFPEICNGREPLVADVIFTDNYGDEHRVPSVRFKNYLE
jgi:hypothetical protein